MFRNPLKPSPIRDLVMAKVNVVVDEAEKAYAETCKSLDLKASEEARAIWERLENDKKMEAERLANSIL